MKNYNWKKGILIILVCGLLGAIVGGALKRFMVKGNLQEIVGICKAISPGLFILAFVLTSIGLGGYFYFNAKLKKDHYCDEEGAFYERNEKSMSIIQICSTLGAIVNFTAFGVNLYQSTALASLFIINAVFAFLGEVCYVSLYKKVRPDLNADPLETGFKKNYYDQLDEYEKDKIGKSSFQTVSAMIPLYVFLFVGCYIVSMLFEISPVIYLPIGIMWTAQTVLLTYYGNKKTKA